MQRQPQHQRVQFELQKISSNIVASVSMSINMEMLLFTRKSDSTDAAPQGISYM